MTETVESPCNNICLVDQKSGLCTGCGRSLAEIAEWSAASPERQRDIVAKLPERMKALALRAD